MKTSTTHLTVELVASAEWLHAEKERAVIVATSAAVIATPMLIPAEKHTICRRGVAVAKRFGRFAGSVGFTPIFMTPTLERRSLRMVLMVSLLPFVGMLSSEARFNVTVQQAHHQK